MSSYYLIDIYRLTSLRTRYLLLLNLCCAFFVSVLDLAVPLLTFSILKRLSSFTNTPSAFLPSPNLTSLDRVGSSTLLFFLGIVIILVAVFRGFLLYLTTRSSASVVLDVTSSYYSRLLNAPYEVINYKITKDSVIANISYTPQFVASYVQPSLILVSSTLTAVVIIVGASLFLPVSNLFFLLGILLAYLTITFLSQPMVRRLNSQSQHHNNTLIQSVSLALENIEILKISNLNPVFVNTFNHNQRILRDVGRYSFLISGLPRTFIEIIFVLSLIITALCTSISYVLVLIPTSLVLLQRLLPPLQSFYSSLSSIRTSRYIPDSFFMHLSLLGPDIIPDHIQFNDYRLCASPSPSYYSPLISLENVSYVFENKQILSSINLSMDRGEWTTIVGPSGSGKSTLVRLIAGLLSPTTGKYSFNGHAIDEFTASTFLFPFISYVPQNPFLLGRTVNDCMSYFHPDTDMFYAEELIRKLDLSHIIDHRDIISNRYKPILTSALSGGERQRLCLFMSLISQPSILLLDEPTSALDPASQSSFLEILHSLAHNTSIISITHRIETISSDQRVFRLVDGYLYTV
jgi:putative ABC transport system ATP-binding protein